MVEMADDHYALDISRIASGALLILLGSLSL